MSIFDFFYLQTNLEAVPLHPYVQALHVLWTRTVMVLVSVVEPRPARAVLLR